jgi:hypothetical protein
VNEIYVSKHHHHHHHHHPLTPSPPTFNLFTPNPYLPGGRKVFLMSIYNLLKLSLDIFIIYCIYTSIYVYICTFDTCIRMYTYMYIFYPRWLKRSFNVDLQSTQTMSGRINHPDETVRKIEWIVDQLVNICLFIHI